MSCKSQSSRPTSPRDNTDFAGSSNSLHLRFDYDFVRLSSGLCACCVPSWCRAVKVSSKAYGRPSCGFSCPRGLVRPAALASVSVCFCFCRVCVRYRHDSLANTPRTHLLRTTPFQLQYTATSHSQWSVSSIRPERRGPGPLLLSQGLQRAIRRLSVREPLVLQALGVQALRYALRLRRVPVGWVAVKRLKQGRVAVRYDKVLDVHSRDGLGFEWLIFWRRVAAKHALSHVEEVV